MLTANDGCGCQKSNHIYAFLYGVVTWCNTPELHYAMSMSDQLQSQNVPKLLMKFEYTPSTPILVYPNDKVIFQVVTASHAFV